MQTVTARNDAALGSMLTVVRMVVLPAAPSGV